MEGHRMITTLIWIFILIPAGLLALAVLYNAAVQLGGMEIDEEFARFLELRRKKGD